MAMGHYGYIDPAILVCDEQLFLFSLPWAAPKQKPALMASAIVGAPNSRHDWLD